MFDHNGILRYGAQRLHVFICHGGHCTESPLNPLGTVLTHSSQENGPCLLIEFTKFAEPVSYPSDDRVCTMLIFSIHGFEYIAKAAEI